VGQDEENRVEAGKIKKAWAPFIRSQAAAVDISPLTYNLTTRSYNPALSLILILID